MERKYELSINPRKTAYDWFSIDLMPADAGTGPFLKNTFADHAQLSNALDRLGIAQNEKSEIIHCLDRGDAYRIFSFPIPDEIAIRFGIRA